MKERGGGGVENMAVGLSASKERDGEGVTWATTARRELHAPG